MLMMVVVVLGSVDDVIGGLLMVMIDLICLRSPISVAFCFQLPCKWLALRFVYK